MRIEQRRIGLTSLVACEHKSATDVACTAITAYIAALIHVKGKVSRYKPEVALGAPGGYVFCIFSTFRQYEGGKVVTLMHRPPSPPGVSRYSFLEAESTPGHMVPSVASEKIPSDTTGDRSRVPSICSAVP
jgi:hypothetical protein